jgi:hypothetical protein
MLAQYSLPGPQGARDTFAMRARVPAPHCTHAFSRVERTLLSAAFEVGLAFGFCLTSQAGGCGLGGPTDFVHYNPSAELSTLRFLKTWERR